MMKVCINFGDIRCVVPVGDGSLAVKEVIDLAVERFRKATSKPAEAQIAVHSLKTCDGAILDVDDILKHVVDDREQLIALFDEFPMAAMTTGGNGSGGLALYSKIGHSLNMNNNNSISNNKHNLHHQPYHHHHQQQQHNGSQSAAMKGIYGEVNHAPTHPHHQRLPSNSAASEASSKTGAVAAAATAAVPSGSAITVNRLGRRIETSATSHSPSADISAATANTSHQHYHHHHHQHQNSSSSSSIGSGRHSMQPSNHYGPLHNGHSAPRPEGIYGRTSSTEQYQYAFQQQQQQQLQRQQQLLLQHQRLPGTANAATTTTTNHHHQRNGSVSDSLLSSNESPDLLPEHVHHQQQQHINNSSIHQYQHHLHNRSESYSSAAHLRNQTSFQSAAATTTTNRSFNGRGPPLITSTTTQPISIGGHRRSAANSSYQGLSQSYDSNRYTSLRRPLNGATDHLSPEYNVDDNDDEEENNAVHEVEITEENISLYATTTAANRSGHMAPVLHVRRGSDPSTTNGSGCDNGRRPPLIITSNGGHHSTVANGHYLPHNAHTDLNDLTNDHHRQLPQPPSSKRWSTAAATTTTTLSSRLFPPQSSMDANYEHSDEEKSLQSVSPQSTKEEGYASEERPNSQPSDGAAQQQQRQQPPQQMQHSNHVQTSPSATTTAANSAAISPPLFGNFTRGSGRLSMLANNYDVWADAADRQLLRSNAAQTKEQQQQQTPATSTAATGATNGQQQDQLLYRRRLQQHQQLQHSQTYDSSLGSMTSTSSQENDHHHHHHHLHQQQQQQHPQVPRLLVTQHSVTSEQQQQQQPPTPSSSSNSSLKNGCLSVIIDMAKESGPLGIHVLPDDMNNDTGERAILKEGLLIQAIEPGGRIDRDGRLAVGDVIVEIDSQQFAGLDFNQAQDIFRSSLQNATIKLLVRKTASSSSSTDICDNRSNRQSTTGDNNNSQQMCSTSTTSSSPKKEIPNNHQNDEDVFVEGEARAGQQTKMATVTTTRKHSIGGGTGAPALLAPNNNSSKPPIVVVNTRRIGKKYHIQLKKGVHSLGFTITTRDNPAGGLSPIYIKTILPRGAAVQDGRLKPGDRLLEVCGIEMTGKTQEEAVKILRNLPTDSIVDLIVSRQEVEMSPSPLMPRQLPPEKVNEPQCSSTNVEREVLVFKIPLNDTLSSGLGVSVKGKTTATASSEGNTDKQQQHIDLGIFVKAVFTGGAAWKDGRLRQDDQLISINDIPLSGKTNSEAMETLRREMIKPQGGKNASGEMAEGGKPDSITVTVARRVCRSPSHFNTGENGGLCSGNDDSSSQRTTSLYHGGNASALNPNHQLHHYHHQHEASILSSHSYDMSFSGTESGGTQSPTKNSSSSNNSPTSPQLKMNGSHNGTGGSSGQEEDSYRSSENTVIFNSRLLNQSSASLPSPVKEQQQQQSTNDTSAAHYDSELSLNEDGDRSASDRFRRDGFGRQSMSEKRHAQLDAKSTDTYRRNKKSREDKLNVAADNDDEDERDEEERNSVVVVEQMEMQTKTSQQHGHVLMSYGEDEDSDRAEAIRRMASASLKENLPLPTNSSSSITPPKSRSPLKPAHLPFFSPCCIQCQSPGSCPYHSKSDIEVNGRSRSGLYVKNTNVTEVRTTMMSSTSASTKEMIVPPFGLRRSCSLESLQMMMQDLQKEQMEKVGGNGGSGSGAFAGARVGTVRVSRGRETNESFRNAVDRSYDTKNYINQSANMDRVDEEFDSNDDSNSRPSTCPYRVGGGHSMTSTNFTSGTALTTTTNEDDGAQLIKPKKKKGLFKNLFHFGSRKGRSKSASSEPSRGEGGGGGSPSNRHSHNDSNTSEEVFRSPDLMRNRQYLVEQERINAQYRKLMEAKQRQQQQQQQQQPPQFVRNQLHPMHQSMPIGQRSRSSPSKQQMMMMEQPLIGSPPTGNANGYAGVHAGSFVPNYGSHPRHSKQRDQTMGVPAIGGQQQQFGSLNIHKKSNESNSKMNAYMMRHRVHPEQIKFGPEGAAHSFGDANAQMRPINDGGPRHLRGNSQDFYSTRSPMDRPGSRVAISESSNYATQGIYSTYGSNNNPNLNPNPNGNGHLSNRADEQASQFNHYRQLSLRNPVAVHHRQISSPAVSGSAAGGGAGTAAAAAGQQYYGTTGHRPLSSYFDYEHLKKNGIAEHQQQSKQMTGPFASAANNNSNYGGNNEAMYGLVGQQIANKRPPPQQQQNLPPNIIRQQQPIYQSNQVQIYGSIYNSVPSNHQAAYGRVGPQPQQQPPPQTMTRSSGGIYGIYGGVNGLPASNAYTTKG